MVFPLTSALVIRPWTSQESTRGTTVPASVRHIWILNTTLRRCHKPKGRHNSQNSQNLQNSRTKNQNSRKKMDHDIFSRLGCVKYLRRKETMTARLERGIFFFSVFFSTVRRLTALPGLLPFCCLSVALLWHFCGICNICGILVTFCCTYVGLFPISPFNLLCSANNRTFPFQDREITYRGLSGLKNVEKKKIKKSRVHLVIFGLFSWLLLFCAFRAFLRLPR